MHWRDRLDTTAHDLRLAWRSVWRSPGFALAVIATLGLGIGANTAIFSFVSGILLRPLPYRNDGELVALQTVLPQFGPEATSVPDFRDWKSQTRSFAMMTATSNAADNLTADGQDPERIRFARVLDDFFPTFGVAPAAGRFFGPDEMRLGGDRVVVLSDALWRRRFGADPALVGKTITLGGLPYLVIGIAPRGFAYPLQAELWSPLVFGGTRPTPPRRADFLQVVARLKPGVSLAAATADMTTIAQRLAATYPASNHGITARVQSLRESLVANVHPALLMLTVAVGFVLLIACANIANLLLARATRRRRDMAVHAALGASRERLAGVILLESLLLALLGGTAGLAAAWWGVRIFKATAPTTMPLLAGVSVDTTVLGFTAVISVITGLAFGFVPAAQAMRLSLRDALGDGAGASGSRRSERLRRSLVAVQAALALTLLSGAALFVQSLVRLQHVDLGFDPTNLLTLRVALPPARYHGPGATAAFFRQLDDRVRAIPGVRAVGMTTDIPLSAAFNYLTLGIVGQPPPGPNDHPPDAIPSSADSAFFTTMATPLVRGRSFTASDDSVATPVAIVNEEFVHRYLGGIEPLGARVSFGGGDADGAMTIVGVSKTTRLDGVGQASYPQLFRPLAQAPDNSVFLTIRTNGVAPRSLIPAIRREVRALDPEQPISDVRTMSERVADSIGQTRLDSTLLAGLAGLALVIAALGIYGVVSYNVARRTREIGVRIALGATRGNVLSLVTRQGMRPVMIGVVIGIGASIALGRVARSLLFGSSGVDPVLLLAAVLLFGVAAIAACLAPAIRASRVAPSIALRVE